MYKNFLVCFITLFALGLNGAERTNISAKEPTVEVDLSTLLAKIDDAKPEIIEVQKQLKYPISGNAVVKVDLENSFQVYSFNGLITKDDGQLKLSNNAWVTSIAKVDSVAKLAEQLNSLTWRSVPDVPSVQKQKGRYVTNAVAIDHMIYLLGGYSTNRLDLVRRQPNKQNVSDFYSFDPKTQSYAKLADMPVPVDDTIILPYQERYLYVVSGWHSDGAVNLVQVFDTYKNEWFQASPLPTAGVFGHAGGIYENQILFCDGQQLEPNFAQAPQFKIQQRCWLGEIDVINPTKITWIEWAHPSEQGKFRMASVTDQASGELWLIGGSTESFDLFGRTNNVTKPERKSDSSNTETAPMPNAEIWRYSFSTRRWQLFSSPNPVMDTPNAILLNNQILTIGGRTTQGMTNKHLIHR